MQPITPSRLPHSVTTRAGSGTMTPLFISYARADQNMVMEIEAGLKASGIETWRDQHQLYGGQRWPKALGEAVAAQQGFLLFWSQAAAASHFVEVEWSTAVALRKPIIPCRLDDTPLPATLSAIQTVEGREAGSAVKELLEALAVLTTEPTEAAAREAVLAQISRISATEPAEVGQAVQHFFQQDSWTVQGNVYQADGDIHINRPVGEAPRTPVSWVATWQARLGLIVALLTSLGLLLDLPGKVGQVFHAPWGSQQPELTLEQTLSGVIWDDQGQPVAGAAVSILDLGLTTTTDPVGTFRFQLKGEKDQEVRLLAQKPGYRADPQFVTLGAKVDLTLRRVP
jgi:hypothetical protein